MQQMQMTHNITIMTNFVCMLKKLVLLVIEKNKPREHVKKMYSSYE